MAVVGRPAGLRAEDLSVANPGTRNLARQHACENIILFEDTATVLSP